MADNQSADQLSFADVQASVTQLVNDNTQQNNAVASQIKEVQRLILDFATKAQQGNAPSQGEFQAVISQLASVHSLVQQNTAAIQATAAQIQDADPASGGGDSEGGSGDTINQGNSGPETTGENSSSGTGETPNQFA